MTSYLIKVRIIRRRAKASQTRQTPSSIVSHQELREDKKMSKHYLMWVIYAAAIGFILFTSTSCKKKPIEMPSHYIPPPLEDTGDVREWDTADEL